MNVSAIIVTRGDVDLSQIIASYDDFADEVLIWDNSKREDLAVYGRYAAIEEARNELIATQDDDVLLPRESIQAILDEWMQLEAFPQDHPGHPHACHVVCNMPARFRDQPQYERGDQALVGFGACFHRDAPARAFSYLDDATFHDDPLFLRTCDIVFTALTPRVLVDVPYEDLPHAHAENRMWKQPQHVEERMRMLELVRKVRDGDQG